ALLVTASHGGDISRTELREYLQAVELDFISPHRPRDAQSPGQTEAKTREYLAWMKDLGHVAPVHYQEPFRRGYGKWNPMAEDFVTDLRAAVAGGAAGWCFHNGDERAAPEGQPRRSFDLREKRLFDQLDAEEREAIQQLAAIPKGPSRNHGRSLDHPVQPDPAQGAGHGGIRMTMEFLPGRRPN